MPKAVNKTDSRGAAGPLAPPGASCAAATPVKYNKIEQASPKVIRLKMNRIMEFFLFDNEDAG
jgi:hypothetical protein